MKIIVADDHAIYRAGLSLLLQQLNAVSSVSEAASLTDALELLGEQPFVLGIFDLDMPGMHGPNGLDALKQRFPRLQLIVLSAASDQSTINACFDKGCVAYLSKASSLSETLRGIAKIVAASTSASTGDPTPRQQEVLRLAATGLTNKQIARNIGIAPGTVKIHMAALFALFGVRNRTELLSRYAAANFAKVASAARLSM